MVADPTTSKPLAVNRLFQAGAWQADTRGGTTRLRMARCWVVCRRGDVLLQTTLAQQQFDFRTVGNSEVKCFDSAFESRAINLNLNSSTLWFTYLILICLLLYQVRDEIISTRQTQRRADNVVICVEEVVSSVNEQYGQSLPGVRRQRKGLSLPRVQDAPLKQRRDHLQGVCARLRFCALLLLQQQTPLTLATHTCHCLCSTFKGTVAKPISLRLRTLHASLCSHENTHTLQVAYVLTHTRGCILQCECVHRTTSRAHAHDRSPRCRRPLLQHVLEPCRVEIRPSSMRLCCLGCREVRALTSAHAFAARRLAGRSARPEPKVQRRQVHPRTRQDASRRLSAAVSKQRHTKAPCVHS